MVPFLCLVPMLFANGKSDVINLNLLTQKADRYALCHGFCHGGKNKKRPFKRSAAKEQMCIKKLIQLSGCNHWQTLK